MFYPRVFLTNLYTTMMKIRTCEECLVEPILQREILCPVHLYSGEEAIAVGVCANLSRQDIVFGSHRSHGHYLAKGGTLKKLIAEIYCRTGGCAGGRGGSMHLIEPEVGFLGAVPIVGGTISLALGAALAEQIKDSGNVSVVFFGDGATGEGVLCEAMNFAGVHKLPIIFVCENNLYSTHMPIRDIRVRNTIFEMAIPFGLMAEKEEGNDVLKVYELSRRAVEHCRAGLGPVFLEFSTYRLRGHVGPDDNVQGTHSDIRPPYELEQWKANDPLTVYRRYLTLQEKFSDDELKNIDNAVLAEVNEAHEWAKNCPKPSPEELLDYVFQ